MVNGTNIVFMDTNRIKLTELPPIEMKLFEILEERNQIQKKYQLKRELIKTR